MAICKCKMCGGDLNITELDRVVECEYCGTAQTVPSADNEKKMTLFNRANKLRFNSEFDKAAGIYESIIADFPEEAEAYWGIVLCKYGIEYVDDPATGKKIPTCHRSSFASVMEDDAFEQACENADATARRVYREEAKRIEEIRRGIIEVSSKEAPYDIFICYKETDENGDRTVDSAIAQDVYTALTEKGYRVFFSRISLEDKLGQEYEPYIFAALQSAKIMLVFGTDYEYFNAVWVKNEWSRFLQLISAGQKKTLIPCYKDIDVYDMPKEFAKLQSQDMGKVGAMQDLLRGIEKILPKVIFPAAVTAPEQMSVITPAAVTTESLLKRAFMFLEDGNWGSADEYAEKVLDIDPENGEAYLAKGMADLKVKNRAGLADVRNLKQNINLSKALRFGGVALQAELKGYIKVIQKAEEKEEEDRIKVEEGRRKEESQVQKTAEKVIAAVRKKQSGRTGINLEQQLSNAQQKAIFLETLCKKYDSIAAQLNQKWNMQSGLQNQINDLQTKKNTLGTFSGKEKKRLEEEINAKSQQVHRISSEIALLTNNLYGFHTKQQVEQALKAVKTEAAKIESQISIEQELNEYSFDQALEIMEKDLRVAKKIPLGIILLSDVLRGRKTVLFGRYPQKSKTDNSPIEWIILKLEEKRILLLSKYALDCVNYNTDITAITWETCFLRRWLSESFLNAAFSIKEQSCIISSIIAADKNPKYSTNPGNYTTDKVFLLSITEANKYFVTNDQRQCKPTVYAVERETKRDASTGGCLWWLRSPGGRSSCAAVVDCRGKIIPYGYLVNDSSSGLAVRPALWINLES